MQKPISVAKFSALAEKQPIHALVSKTDLVVIRYGDEVSVLYGRCLHRGALLSDGSVEGDNLICGLHNWDYRIDTGVSEYNNSEVLNKFTATIEGDDVIVDEQEVIDFEVDSPPAFNRDEYLGAYADTHPENTEPYTNYIKELAQNGLKNYGHHGPSAAMGVDRNTLPKWEDIQFLPGQLSRRPLLDHEGVATKTVIGPGAKIWSANHGFSDPSIPIQDQEYENKKVIIGNGCWIGANAFLMPGVNLGEGCIVSAGAVVGAKNYPAYKIIAGNPARVIGTREIKSETDTDQEIQDE